MSWILSFLIPFPFWNLLFYRWDTDPFSTGYIYTYIPLAPESEIIDCQLHRFCEWGWGWGMHSAFILYTYYPLEHTQALLALKSSWRGLVIEGRKEGSICYSWRAVRGQGVELTQLLNISLTQFFAPAAPDSCLLSFLAKFWTKFGCFVWSGSKYR